MYKILTKAFRRLSKNKIKTLLFLCMFVSFIYFDETNNGVNPRRLKCRELSDHEIHRKMADIGHDDPCITIYPDKAQEIVLAPDSDKALEEPTFDTIPENDDDSMFALSEGDDGKYILSPESEGDSLLDEAEFDLMDSYEPRAYDPERAIAEAIPDDKNAIGYIVVATECPELEQSSPSEGSPSGDYNENEPVIATDLYEASAVMKAEVCEITEKAVTARRLGHTRKLRQLEDLNQLSAAEMNYTMHAIVHPAAVECPIQGISETSSFDRVKLHQSLNYKVDILGHPFTVSNVCSGNKEYICANIQNCGVGVRESTILHLWTSTSHPIVILVDYNTVLQQPLDQEIDLLLADESLKGFYIKTPPDATSGDAGVDTGFMVIKPSEEEFENIKNAYINTPFNPTTGWNGQGRHNFMGCLGISSFLSYYFSNDDGYVELDRCTFAHSADEDCLAKQSFSSCKGAKMYDKVCGNPRKCPYDHPDWSAQKKEACVALHQKYYNSRYEFENKYFNKQNKQERIGLFKRRSFLGYCRGPGRKGFLSIVGEVIPVPEWQSVCPPVYCGAGYMKQDCTCTGPDPEDACSACPEGTYCQTSPSLMCVDCECGFCDDEGTRCCDFNNNNNCKDGPGNNKQCIMQFDFFPAFRGSGNVCGGVEISRTAVPNGCGCKPNSYSPCTFNKSWAGNKSCFICTAQDLANGDCKTCKDCIAKCPKASCITESITKSEFMACLKKIKDDECRASCHSQCVKT